VAVPPALNAERQARVKAAIQGAPRDVGINLGDRTWKVARQCVRERSQVTLGRRSCLSYLHRSYLHRLGFVLKRPQQRLLKANPERRALVVREPTRLPAPAAAPGAKISCVDEAHFDADLDRRGTWVLKGEPALVGPTGPRDGEQASSSSAVGLEPGEGAAMALDGNRGAETSVACLRQRRAHPAEPSIIIRDTGPAHAGDALRADRTTPDVRLRLVRLPADSPDFNPDFNPDEASWGRIRAAVTAHTCFGTRATVQQHVGQFFRDIVQRTEEVQRR
jgi:DDE superfamily endonuclease